MQRSSIAAVLTVLFCGALSAQSTSPTPPRDFITAPKHEYPLEARLQHWTGSGIAVAQVDTKTGYVTSVRIEKSTDHKILDDSALKEFRKWRFKANTAHEVRLPIRFTMDKT